MCYSVFSFWHKKAQRFSSSVLCVVGGFCFHGSSNPFSIGKYPFFIYKIELKNFARKKQKSLEKSRLFAAISFLSPFYVILLQNRSMQASLYNLSVSCFDIIDILCFLKLPKNCLYFRDFILTVKETDKPIIIHRLSVTSKLDKIDHVCFQYAHNKLAEIHPVPESSEVIKLKQEFINQFDFKS